MMKQRNCAVVLVVNSEVASVENNQQSEFENNNRNNIGTQRRERASERGRKKVKISAGLFAYFASHFFFFVVRYLNVELLEVFMTFTLFGLLQGCLRTEHFLPPRSWGMLSRGICL